jgi:hypothetical protein
LLDLSQFCGGGDAPLRHASSEIAWFGGKAEPINPTSEGIEITSTEVAGDTRTPAMEATVLEREFMKHPDIEHAERCWKEAALALREAQASHIASATDATAGWVAQAELAVEKCEANWEAAIMQHGIPDDGIQFNVATQFLFQDRPKSSCR